MLLVIMCYIVVLSETLNVPVERICDERELLKMQHTLLSSFLGTCTARELLNSLALKQITTSGEREAARQMQTDRKARSSWNQR